MFHSDSLKLLHKSTMNQFECCFSTLYFSPDSRTFRFIPTDGASVSHSLTHLKPTGKEINNNMNSFNDTTSQCEFQLKCVLNCPCFKWPRGVYGMLFVG